MRGGFEGTYSAAAFKVLTIVGCLGTLGFLLAEMVRENFAGEWRAYQKRYIEKVDPALRAGFEIGIKQAFLPELDRVDRCQSCHIGIDDPAMADQAQPLTTHPGELLRQHPPETYGCTICHQGQGRAIERQAAHGRVAHWEEPLLEGDLVYTTCGRCHPEGGLFGFERELFAKPGAPTEVHVGDLEATVPGAEVLRRGKRLFAESGCLGCHLYRGVGGVLGPDLTHVGDKGVHGYDFSHLPAGVERTPLAWLEQHFMDPGAVSPGTVMPGIGSTREDARALAAYMLSLHAQTVPTKYRPPVFAARGDVADGSRLYRLFCVACHGRDLAGSDVPEIRTPSLSNEDFLAVADREYLTYIITNGRSGTHMPAWGPDTGGLSKTQIDRLVDYVMSFAADRTRPADVSVRDGDPRYGRSVYRGNCAACHGLDGEGGIGTRLNSPDFLAMSSDEFLVRTILDGRPGTGMPSWRNLEPQAVSDLLAYVRTWGDVGAEVSEVLALLESGEVDPTMGARLYRARCAACHGAGGGGAIGPSLDNDGFQSLVSDEFLVRSIRDGRPGTAMPAWRDLEARDLADLVSFIRSLSDAPRAVVEPTVAQGDPDHGRLLYERACASCHGRDAVGGVGPQLRNPVFLDLASDGYLFRTIADGRPGTAMRGFLRGSGSNDARTRGAAGIAEFTAPQIADIVAWLRLQQYAAPSEAPRYAVLGSASRGREIYEGQGGCARCHGEAGQGGVGPALGGRAFLARAPEGYLLGTMVLGRHGTEMRAFAGGGIADLSTEQLMDVAAYVRTLAGRRPPGRAGWRRYESTEDRIAIGAELFASNCASCHGVDGRGGYAPELHNPEFLAAASDGFLMATIARGRKGTPMRSFGFGPASLVNLSHEDLRDLVGYMRSWESSSANDERVTIASNPQNEPLNLPEVSTWSTVERASTDATFSSSQAPR